MTIGIRMFASVGAGVRRAPSLAVRTYATRPAPVELAYEVYEPKEVKNPGQSLVLCHGLFGSKQNWRSIAKAWTLKLGMPVYTVDLRNHGASPHATPHKYTAMAEDLSALFHKNGLENINLLGHSMGGKAVMAYALNKELNGNLRTLISVDMTPAQGRISPDFDAYLNAMSAIEDAKVKTRGEADKILTETEPNKSIRQFLLTNLMSGPDGHMVFRVPVDLLKDAVPNIGDFPYTPPPPVTDKSPQWDGPMLLLKGAHSKYVNRTNIPITQAFFPKMRLETLDTGHWVHSERPQETVDIVTDFVHKA